MIARTSVQKHRYEKEVNQSPSDFNIVASVLSPLVDKIGYARYIADLEVLPPTMRRDRVEVIWTEISLQITPLAFWNLLIINVTR